jgi:UDP-GlcNAc:undecaprenyl-phosphate/decaprenyl-phosphate GlcNAc-1-phosphate transferase
VKFASGVELALPYLIGALLVAAALSFVLTPLVQRVAHRLDVVDRPNHRRVNTRPVARGGGLAVAASFLIATGLFLVLNSGGTLRPPASIGSTELAALLFGGAAATLVGVLDDYWQLRARWQLLGQLAIAAVAVVLGAIPESIGSPFGGLILLATPVGVIFAIVWILGMINSTNFIDGLDGLSPGIGLIAAATLGLISLTTAVGPLGQPFVAVLCFALVGALAGFLRWNFHPATIFVGTSGVMFIGYTLALLSILGTAKVAVAILVLGVPIIDTFWIIVRRIGSGRSPFTPDRGHIHHRLLDLGLTHRQTVLLIYGVCIVLGILALVLSISQQVIAFVVFLVGSGLTMFVLARRSVTETGRGAIKASRGVTEAGRGAIDRPDEGATGP